MLPTPILGIHNSQLITNKLITTETIFRIVSSMMIIQVVLLLSSFYVPPRLFASLSDVFLLEANAQSSRGYVCSH